MPVSKQQEQLALALFAPAAVISEKRTEFPAAITLAQAILESDWATAIPGNNAFGIKAHKGLYVLGSQSVLTHEQVAGKLAPETLSFATYADISDCFSDHAYLITHVERYREAWFQYRYMGRDVLTLLQTISPIYATDKDYYLQVREIMQQSNVLVALAEARAKAVDVSYKET